MRVPHPGQHQRWQGIVAEVTATPARLGEHAGETLGMAHLALVVVEDERVVTSKAECQGVGVRCVSCGPSERKVSR